MSGVDRHTGKPLDGDAHLAQSIFDILSTPIGTRVMRRDYGSALFKLADAPFNPATQLRMYAATATALKRWEPRLALTRISIALGDVPGAFIVSLEGTRTDRTAGNSLTRLTLPLRLSAPA
ncbi:GPW/gp25 family protein [Sphingomonas sp. PR090111-T3T-6A]|uniref:GPW/gp25 family protein n=1 Tax=Sphingomonas sp. PR090111-T3T-6A TaxID=685778 RepID=UPI00036648FB|nr:GPW/gp25 family protein [Sphingomonas sp. PR090111-T3T-6A]